VTGGLPPRRADEDTSVTGRRDLVTICAIRRARREPGAHRTMQAAPSLVFSTSKMTWQRRSWRIHSGSSGGGMTCSRSLALPSTTIVLVFVT
jgi:hypothetical protein